MFNLRKIPFPQDITTPPGVSTGFMFDPPPLFPQRENKKNPWYFSTVPNDFSIFSNKAHWAVRWSVLTIFWATVGFCSAQSILLVSIHEKF